MGDQTRWVDTALGEQIQKDHHISLCRPADIANRIVVTAREVVRVMYAGASRAAEKEFDLLAEPPAPIEIDLGVAKTHDATSIPDKQGRHFNRMVVLRGSRQ